MVFPGAFDYSRRTPTAWQRHVEWFSLDMLRLHVQRELPLVVAMSSSTSTEVDHAVYTCTLTSSISKNSWSVSYRYSEFVAFKAKLDDVWTCHDPNCSGSCQTLRDIVSAFFPKKCLPVMSSIKLITTRRKNKFENVLTHLLRSVLLAGSVMKCLHVQQHLPDNLFEFLGVEDAADRRSALQIFVDNYQTVISRETEDNEGISSGDATSECMICLSDVDLGRGNQRRDPQRNDTESSDTESSELTTSEAGDSRRIELNSDEGNTQIVLPCKHAFHRKCIFQWLLFEFHCPTCRTSLSPNAFTTYCRPRNYSAQWWLSDFADDLTRSMGMAQ
ncbi:unnamed protein product [Phytophthora fragariaefolia]|uniref:Unnamed protein product n=1 Tax=Phytophthora fragariaefolia TaxID=1490495 RepID=A0A9W6XGQ1_9STRA|nr:unnamed protein product [Phytophthora fragariaefolia]